MSLCLIQGFGTINKVYASGGEPCCAECVTPVFSEAWSPRASVKNKLPIHQEETTQDEVEVKKDGGEGGEGNYVKVLTLLLTRAYIHE